MKTKKRFNPKSFSMIHALVFMRTIARSRNATTIRGIAIAVAFGLLFQPVAPVWAFTEPSAQIKTRPMSIKAIPRQPSPQSLKVAAMDLTSDNGDILPIGKVNGKNLALMYGSVYVNRAGRYSHMEAGAALIDTSNGKTVRKFSTGGSFIRSAALSENHKYLALLYNKSVTSGNSITSRDLVTVLNLASGKENVIDVTGQVSNNGESGRINSVTIDNRGNLIVLGEKGKKYIGPGVPNPPIYNIPIDQSLRVYNFQGRLLQSLSFNENSLAEDPAKYLENPNWRSYWGIKVIGGDKLLVYSKQKEDGIPTFLRFTVVTDENGSRLESDGEIQLPLGDDPDGSKRRFVMRWDPSSNQMLLSEYHVYPTNPKKRMYYVVSFDQDSPKISSSGAIPNDWPGILPIFQGLDSKGNVLLLATGQQQYGEDNATLTLIDGSGGTKTSEGLHRFLTKRLGVPNDSFVPIVGFVADGEKFMMSVKVWNRNARKYSNYFISGLLTELYSLLGIQPS